MKEEIILARIAYYLSCIAIGIAIASIMMQKAEGSEYSCTWYGDAHKGLPMANTKPFNPEHLTCATYLYPLGTWIEVSYNGKIVWVEVTDRCDDKTDIDLSRYAFSFLEDIDQGRINVTIKAE